MADGMIDAVIDTVIDTMSDNRINEEMDTDSAVAIVGMACRFPDANSPDAFWQNLSQAKESIAFFSDDEMLADGVDPALLRDPNYVKAGTVLANHDCFDAFFFGFTPREAEVLDPQHRLMLECAWEAVEHGGYPASDYDGAIGVFAGVGLNGYLLDNLYPNSQVMESIGAYQLLMDNDRDFLATRIAYMLNLTGPAINVQTACSTSLVAVHLACQSILLGECDMALAGGGSVQVPQKTGHLYQEGMIVSPDGHCRVFSDEAQGTIGGNGVGMVLLKRLEDALTDGDTIYAVIRGSAINNDGSVKMTYTAPSVNGQANVIREAQAVADVDPETISYVEAHGTGTVLGDPIEIAALKQAFDTDEKGYCAIGSVKSNIGHADSGAGVAGLIKTALALTHKQIPASLHFERPNPKIDFANSPFYVNTQLSPWQCNETPRRAGVSSFGVGGTNAHVVLEEAPPAQPSEDARAWQLLTLSAKSATTLLQAKANLAAHLAEYPEHRLADVAYTLAVGRQRHAHRAILVCQANDEAQQHLGCETAGGHSYSNFVGGDNRPVAFMFPGQGSQYVNMGLDLYQEEPLFREQVDICAEILQPIMGYDLRTLLYPSPEKMDDAAQQLAQTAHTQPAIFVISYALAQLWRTWGIEPQAMIGHSIGEFVAATLAGVLSLQDALTLVAHRGRLMQSLPTGAMLAVPLPEEQLRLEDDRLSLAAVNGPERCVVSGPAEAIETYAQRLTTQDIACRQLHTSHAFHSAMMNPILADFARHVQSVQLNPPQLPYMSNVTGGWITAQEATDPAYWVKHLRQTVYFSRGLASLLTEPDLMLLEVGPGRSLSTLAQPLTQPTHATARSLRHPREEQSDSAFLLTALGQLWVEGATIDWDAFYGDARRQRLPLPTYPFERQRYWIDATHAASSTTRQESLIQRRAMDEWFYVPSWIHVPLLPQTLPSQATWLLFEDECGLGQQLAAQLRDKGQRVITVRKGDGFSQLSADAFVINPQQRAEYSQLWQALAGTSTGTSTVTQTALPQKIVHLWSITDSKPDSAEPTLTDSFDSLLYTAQAIGEQHITDALDLFVIANHLSNVTGMDMVQPITATSLGIVYVLPHEYENIHCRAVDVAWSAANPSTHQQTTTVTQLVNELGASLDDGPVDESIVAYRGSRRWRSTVEPIQLTDTTVPIRRNGVYLITGGLGGIGLSLAEALADWETTLVLWSRTALPARTNWSEWLATHSGDEPTSQKIRRLQAIEAKGGRVLVQAVDVADEAAVQAAIEDATAQIGPIHGVIHAAGIGGDNLIHQTDHAATQTVLAPKVTGTQNLHQQLRQMPLDFFVHCSSLNALFGALGQVAYTAANAFQDAFAQSSPGSQSGGVAYPVLSINWDGWREVGMAAYQFEADETEMGLSPAEGCEVFLKALGSGQPQVVVSTHDFVQLRQRIESLQNALSAPTAQTHERPQIGVDYAAPQTPVEQWLTDIWQGHIGINQLGRDDDFFLHLAGDSLSAVSLLNRIQDGLGAIIHLQAIFEASTIEQMADYLQTHYIEQLIQLGLVDKGGDEAVGMGIDNHVVQTTGHMHGDVGSSLRIKKQTTDPTVLLNQLDQLSEDEIDKALATLLGGSSDV
ncbi:MAG: SDR family NAD(P)-dependent oxidoreductase [Chloroflexota bacterium]